MFRVACGDFCIASLTP
nr:hypothetical protein [Vibrio lentus]